jgi:hypothetical protein
MLIKQLCTQASKQCDLEPQPYIDYHILLYEFFYILSPQVKIVSITEISMIKAKVV